MFFAHYAYLQTNKFCFWKDFGILLSNNSPCSKYNLHLAFQDFPRPCAGGPSDSDGHGRATTITNTETQIQ